MAYSQPAQTENRWSRPDLSRARRRRLLLSVALVLARSWPLHEQAALVLDNGRPAASPDEHPVPIVSLEKVMTAYLTLKHYPLSRIQDGSAIAMTAIQAQEEAQDTAENQSDVVVVPGEQVTERQLLEGLLIPSGSSIARILAAQFAGSETGFVAEMNAEARARNGPHDLLRSARLGSGHGLHRRRQLRGFQEAMRFPVFRQIVSMSSVTLPVADTLAQAILAAAGSAARRVVNASPAQN